MIKDSFNRDLHLGDKLMNTTGEPTVFTIVDIKASMNPKLPKGATIVTIQSTVNMIVLDGKPMPGFVRVMSIAEVEMGEKSDAKPDGGDGEKATTIKLA